MSPGAALLEQQRQEVHLEEHVAELVEELGVVARVRGVGELVGLLDGVGHDRALVLLAIPRALDAQPARQGVELRDGYGDIRLRRHAAGAYDAYGVVVVCGACCCCCCAAPVVSVGLAFGPFLQSGTA